MAAVNSTSELRSAKEKFLYFHHLTACNRICGARFFCALNSFRFSGLNLRFPSFFHHEDVLSQSVVTPGLLSRLSEPVVRLSDRRFSCSSVGLMRRVSSRLKFAVVMIAIDSFKPMPDSVTGITQRLVL